MPETHPDGATVVITHRIPPDRHDAYEAWLAEIAPLARASPGHLDWQIIRPVPGITASYTVIIRFDTTAHLRQWVESDTRRRLIDRVAPLLDLSDVYTIHSGLDYWFMPQGAGAKTPAPWKQLLVTWSAIYPLALVVPPGVLPIVHQVGEHRALDILCVTGVMVVLMVYVVMPRYTRLVRRWLYA